MRPLVQAAWLLLLLKADTTQCLVGLCLVCRGREEWELVGAAEKELGLLQHSRCDHIFLNLSSYKPPAFARRGGPQVIDDMKGSAC